MSLELKIVLSAIGVFALTFILCLISILWDGRRQRRERKQAAWRREVMRYDAELGDEYEETRPRPGKGEA
jgi:hypothetical protein